MFGLMKPASCSGRPGGVAFRRMHYCGTCKTMGRMYGQRSRMLLNNDSVFLAELLTELGPQRASANGWARSLKSYNCASLPQSDDEMPFALKYAASATLLLGELKLQDRAVDRPGRGVQLAANLYSAPFIDAARWLANAGLDVKAIRSLAEEQPPRERAARSGIQADVLDLCAEPTARMTEMVFRTGALSAGLNSETADLLAALGLAFGKLAYLVDACEDIRKDAKRQEFNAFAAAYPNLASEEKLAELHGLAAEIAASAAGAAAEAIRALPLSQPSIDQFVQTLLVNTSEHIGRPIAVEAGACCSAHASKASKPLPRLKTALQTAARLTAKHRAECAGVPGVMRAPFVFAGVGAAALLFPRQAISSATARECIGLMFSLLLWGSAAKATADMLARAVAAPFVLAGNIPGYFMDKGPVSSSSSRRGGGTVVTTTTTTSLRRGPTCCQLCACDCCANCACDCCTDLSCSCCAAEGCCDCASCGCDVCSGCA